MVETVLFIIDIFGTIVFAISGAIVAMRKDMDLFGMCMMALATATGGGIIRDMILGRTPPVIFQTPLYAVLALVTALVCALPFVRRFFDKYQGPWDDIMFVFDTLGLASFTVTGATAGYQYAYDGHVLYLTIFVGTLTGVGGSVIRDIFAAQIPDIFVRHFYAMTCICGAFVFGLAWEPLGRMWAMALCFVTVVVLRVLAAVFHWDMPSADKLDRLYTKYFHLEEKSK